MIFEMDWYFDIIVLVGTFFVIAMGMTIYARLNPTRPRVRRGHYIYTGIIPTITISSADSPTKRSPTTLTPADSVDVEDDENKSKKSPVDDTELARQLQCSENNRLSIPLDDDDEDEEEQQQSVQPEDICVPTSKPVATVVGEKKNKSEAISVTSSPVKNVEKDGSHAISLSSVSGEQGRDSDNDNSEDMKQSKEVSNTGLLLDKSDDEDHSQSASLSAIDNIEDDLSDTSMDLSDMLTKFDDLRSSPIPNSSESCTNNNLRKIGTSHTVEDPLFPFSEIFEEENPSTRNRLKKRFSQ